MIGKYRDIEITIDEIKTEQDAVFITYSVTTKLGDKIITQTAV